MPLPFSSRLCPRPAESADTKISGGCAPEIEILTVEDEIGHPANAQSMTGYLFGADVLDRLVTGQKPLDLLTIDSTIGCDLSQRSRDSRSRAPP